MALIVAWLGIPRPVAPEHVPLPRIDRTLHRQQLQQEHLLVQEAWLGLPLPVRVVGEWVRRLGRAEAIGDVESVHLTTEELRVATRTAAEHSGGHALRMLRALQTHLFLKAVGRAKKTGRTNRELLELGGNFWSRAQKNRWLARSAEQADDAELAALFQIRWTRLLGLEHAAGFAPRLNDWRWFYRLRLRLPDVATPGERGRTEARLADVDALSRLDDQYPVDYARGVLLYQQGALVQALESFRSHLQRGDTEWSLRARNHATACALEILE